ncbi:MAG TPA: OsmC family protein [Acidimicrobiia bacterium]|nr:OsmC family protein [Acidimicrobiia bacterium]
MTTTYRLNDVDIESVAALTAACREDVAKAGTTWRAEVDWTGGFRTQSRIRDFQQVSDEPPALGGTDTGPNPVEQLLAALGNCLAVGVAANATARGIAIDRLGIAVEGDLDLSTFLGITPGHAGFDSIRVEVEIECDADAETVEDLIQDVGDTSPVGHTLSRPIPLSITAV